MKEVRVNHYTAYLKVAVDEYEGGRIAGCVYSRRLAQPMIFMSIEELLLRIDDLLDEQDFPRAFQRKRTFIESDVPSARGSATILPGIGLRYMGEKIVENAQGKWMTFTLNILTRQNTSWQGYLDWLDGSERMVFDSDLELLSMINERIGSKK